MEIDTDIPQSDVPQSDIPQPQISHRVIYVRGPPRKYTYVTLVMKGDKYAIGAITLAQSIRTNCRLDDIDITCMITHDVSPAYRDALSKFFDRVVEVDYITKPTYRLRTYKQHTMYKSWVNSAYTKWQCLDLVYYEKVLFLDADKIVIKDCSELFDLSTPAGTFSSPWAVTTVKHGLKDYYNSPNPLKHGDIVNPEMIKAGLYNTFVCIGTAVLLSPSAECYKAYNDFLARHNAYGNPSCFSMVDEQCLAEFMLEYNAKNNGNWTAIHHIYNYIPWKPGWLNNGYTAADTKIHHYFNIKPWEMKEDEWPDLKEWWKYANAAMDIEPELRNLQKNINDKN